MTSCECAISRCSTSAHSKESYLVADGVYARGMLTRCLFVNYKYSWVLMHITKESGLSISAHV